MCIDWPAMWVGEYRQMKDEIDRLKAENASLTKCVAACNEDVEIGLCDPRELYLRWLCRAMNYTLYYQDAPAETMWKVLDRLLALMECDDAHDRGEWGEISEKARQQH